jgi:hypothetical protein
LKRIAGEAYAHQFQGWVAVTLGYDVRLIGPADADGNIAFGIDDHCFSLLWTEFARQGVPSKEKQLCGQLYRMLRMKSWAFVFKFHRL